MYHLVSQQLRLCYLVSSYISWCLGIDGRDKTVKFWDTRTSTPAAVVNLCERAYSMDTKGAMMVVATADRKVGSVSFFVSVRVGLGVSPVFQRALRNFAKLNRSF